MNSIIPFHMGMGIHPRADSRFQEESFPSSFGLELTLTRNKDQEAWEAFLSTPGKRSGSNVPFLSTAIRQLVSCTLTFARQPSPSKTDIEYAADNSLMHIISLQG
jgi:hypothetical protein